MKKEWRMSASFISCFKACAYRCYAQYVLGIRPIEDTDSQRQGTNWHKVLEIFGAGKGMDAVIDYLNECYNEVPMSKTKDEWETERNILLYSLCGYNWNYEKDDYEVVAEELEFRLPVRNPVTGRALPNVVLDGKIDKIVRSLQGIYYIDEHKSTAKSIDSDSSYWAHLNLDTQTHLYPYAAQQLQLAGEFIPFGIKPDDPLIAGIRYDVWHKPQIKPKKLTQADSKKFAEDGKYMNEQFEVSDTPTITVNGIQAETESGKKEGTLAIRETPEMFGARLLVDISERPEFYFARREISRTADDLKRFEHELCNIYHAVKFIERSETWWKNESQCEATFRCPYINICYSGLPLDKNNVPEGFKNIFGDKNGS